MIKYNSFDRFRGEYWPYPEDLKPYFFAPKGKEWFSESGNDTARFSLEGIEGTGHLPQDQGRIDINLRMWGYPGLGVYLAYDQVSRQSAFGYASKGDLSKLKVFARSLHADLLPVGLFIPFEKAFEAVKESIESEGELPKSIEWIAGKDLPPDTFPDPTDDVEELPER